MKSCKPEHPAIVLAAANSVKVFSLQKMNDILVPVAPAPVSTIVFNAPAPVQARAMPIIVAHKIVKPRYRRMARYVPHRRHYSWPRTHVMAASGAEVRPDKLPTLWDRIKNLVGTN